MGRVLDAVKRFHRFIQEAEHLKKENFRSMEELSTVQIRRGKIFVAGGVLSASLVFFNWMTLGEYLANPVVFISVAGGSTSYLVGRWNKYKLNKKSQ